MTADPVRQLAQANPVPNLTTNVGVLSRKANALITDLSSILRELDRTTEALKEHGLTFDVDLGPIGNAAAAARRDLEKQKPARTFELPR